jgi:hypothetical protein
MKAMNVYSEIHDFQKLWNDDKSIKILLQLIAVLQS